MPLDTLTMRPQPWASIPGRTMKLSRAAAVTLMAIAVAHWLASMVALGPSGQTTAALLTSRPTGTPSLPDRAECRRDLIGVANVGGQG